MQTQITVRHTDATTYHRQYAQEALDKLNQVHSRIQSARVVLTEEGLEKKAEVAISVRGQELFAEETGPALEAAVDRCVARLRRSLLKHKSAVRNTDPNREIWH